MLKREVWAGERKEHNSICVHSTDEQIDLFPWKWFRIRREESPEQSGPRNNSRDSIKKAQVEESAK